MVTSEGTKQLFLFLMKLISPRTYGFLAIDDQLWKGAVIPIDVCYFWTSAGLTSREVC